MNIRRPTLGILRIAVARNVIYGDRCVIGIHECRKTRSEAGHERNEDVGWQALQPNSRWAIAGMATARSGRSDPNSAARQEVSLAGDRSRLGMPNWQRPSASCLM
jgi:hypothetical protein